MKLAIAFALAIGVLMTTSPASARDRPGIERIGGIVLNGQKLPFSNAVRAGDTVYLSGQAGLKPDGTLANGFDAQARQTMENITGILKSAGLGWRDVTKCTVMLANVDDWPAFNKIYASYFPDGNFPARSAFGANRLALPGMLVELECIAYAGAK